MGKVEKLACLLYRWGHLDLYIQVFLESSSTFHMVLSKPIYWIKSHGNLSVNFLEEIKPEELVL